MGLLPGAELRARFFLDKDGQVASHDTKKDDLIAKFVHIIVIANNDSDNPNWGDGSSFQDALSKCKEMDEKGIYFDIHRVAYELVERKIEFILFPHFTKNNGLEDAFPDCSSNKPLAENMGQKTSWIVSGFFPLLDGRSNDFDVDLHLKMAYRDILDAQNDEESAPIVLTSDNHNYMEYCADAKPLSFFKALPTFSGLLMCASDYSSRICRLPPSPPANFISKIVLSVSSGAKIKPFEIQLSPYLNTIIGNRSAGKSLLLDQISSKAKGTTPSAIYDDFISSFSSLQLFDRSGVLYKGNPTLLQQGSVASKFLNRAKEMDADALASEFKNLFPSELPFDFVTPKKESVRSQLEKLDKQLEAATHSRASFDSINAIDYLVLGKQEDVPFWETDLATQTYNLAAGNFHHLQSAKEYLDSALKLTDEAKLKEKLQEVINLFSEEIVRRGKDVKQKNEILTFLVSYSSLQRSKSSAEQVSYLNHRQNLSSMTQQLADSISLSAECFQIGKNLCRDIADLKNQTSKSFVEPRRYSSYQFSVSVTNTFGPMDIVSFYADEVKNPKLSGLQDLEGAIKQIFTSKKYEKFARADIESDSLKFVNDHLFVNKEISRFKEDGAIERVSDMSPGEKAVVYFDILLSKKDDFEPLLIDQPEDDMDNSSIFKELVDHLIKIKGSRQIIAVTHDANVVVNGDAENVIIASNKKGIISYSSGALESKNIGEKHERMRDVVCDHLEGGTKAFYLRSKKYDIDRNRQLRKGQHGTKN